MKVIDMIRRAVSGESHDQKIPAAHLAELLHSARTPAYDRRPLQTQLADQVVGSLGGAGERARKNFGMREDETFSRTGVVEKRRHRHSIDFTVANVTRVQAVEQKDS